MNWNTIGELRNIEKQISLLRKALNKQGLLMELPKNFPNHVHLLDSGKEIWLYTHNILGWILGIVLNKKKDTMLLIRANEQIGRNYCTNCWKPYHTNERHCTICDECPTCQLRFDDNGTCPHPDCNNYQGKYD